MKMVLGDRTGGVGIVWEEVLTAGFYAQICACGPDPQAAERHGYYYVNENNRNRKRPA